MKARLMNTSKVLGLVSIFLFASNALAFASSTGAIDMRAIDANDQTISCYGEDNDAYNVSRTRKTLAKGVEGESLRKKIKSKTVTEASASYTTDEGTLVVSPSASSWTDVGGETLPITCEFGSDPAIQPALQGDLALAASGKTVTCTGDDDYSWTLDAKRQTIKVKVEGESAGAQAIVAKDADQTHASFTTSEGTLDFTAAGTTWTSADPGAEAWSIECH